MPERPAESEEVALLKRIRLFDRLDGAALAEIARAARRRRVKAGATLFREGAPADVFYVLEEGRAKLTQLTAEGHQVVLRFADPGEMLGVIAALADSEYPASAEAVGECVALAWDGKTMGRLMDRYPRIALAGLRLVAARLHELQERFRELATERVERRIARALLRLVRQAGKKVADGVLIDLPLTRQDLAEITGTTLFTVSRTLQQWDRLGIVTPGRKRLLVRQPHRLVSIAEDLGPGAGPAAE